MSTELLAAMFIPWWVLMHIGARILLFLTTPLKNPTEDSMEGSV